MSFCRECGKQIDDDWKACPHCASVISSESSQIKDSAVFVDSSTTINQPASSTDISDPEINHHDLEKYRNWGKWEIGGGLVFAIIAADSIASYVGGECDWSTASCDPSAILRGLIITSIISIVLIILGFVHYNKGQQ